MDDATEGPTETYGSEGPPRTDEFETHPLAKASLDALPTQVAILDGAGDIVYTNHAWQRFARDNDFPGSPQMLGTNYLSVCDTSTGAGATDAGRGIRSVLDGERDEFSLEYPCHGPDERRWFAMRAIRFRHDGRRFALVLHLDVTERKLSELDAERQNTQLRTVDSINVLIRDIIQSLLEVETRAELEDIVCDRLAESVHYEAAWVASTNGQDETISVRTSTGMDESSVTSIDQLTADEAKQTGVRSALNSDRPTVVHATGDAAGAVQSLGLDDGYRSYVAVPLQYRDARYGVLVVHSNTETAFSEWERAAFAVLGETLGHASNAIENRRLLYADFVTELEFVVGDPESFLTVLSARADCEVELTGFVPLADDAVLQYATVDGTDAATVEAVAETVDTVENVSVISTYDDGLRLEYAVSNTSLVSLLAEYGVNVHTATAVDGDVRVTAEAVTGADIREVIEAVRSEFTNAELISKREVKRETQTLSEYWDELTERLTDRQLSMLRAAYHAGFFEWPRESSGEEVAASFDLSAATFHEHTRIGLEKMLTMLFDRER
ncbi:Predicted DNA binding protein, contains HTH domain [Halogranum rubrum]|uniref:Predicted DNA binding protein, contains HTH domain n=1 Tax=Halogranum rubrum TaxID=553466 RepID=A0A1I4E1P5_9EURY|nr:bacterio-opsin activator domain-containing protein [Halogranum rubrum]SFK98497.1 Predicted DNA binding protein, contains HTH domain [Halogranum rubrum]